MHSPSKFEKKNYPIYYIIFLEYYIVYSVKKGSNLHGERLYDSMLIKYYFAELFFPRDAGTAFPVERCGPCYCASIFFNVQAFVCRLRKFHVTQRKKYFTRKSKKKK